MTLTLRSALSAFGREAKKKLSNPAAAGEPEDQLRAPLEHLLKDLAELCGLPRDAVDAVGESSIAELKTRPDYAVVVRNALVGFVEVKAPGKGAEPRRFKGHDKDQWDKLRSLPNLLYTDGNEFSLWRSGDVVGSVVRLAGDVEASGADLDAPPELLRLFDDFLGWQPVPPRDAKQLAQTSARLCRLLRAEVAEQLARKSPALTALATDWRKLLFPEADDAAFADGYAQAVTFGMLMARARGIELGTGLDRAAKELGRTNSLIGAALRLLTDDAGNQDTLKTSLGTLTRVLDAVNWRKISKGDPDAWLYFYEAFLEVYDNDLRKQTGSYYTPPEVVTAMVRLVDEVLRSPARFDVPAGLASPNVSVCDPAVGTGTYMLGVLRHVAAAVAADAGDGAVPGAVRAAVKRLVGFELQLGPFAVAQLRVLAELFELTGTASAVEPRMFVTDTLADPYVEHEWLPASYAPIGASRQQANLVKAKERIWAVIGNPPYKEKAKGRGGWVESGGQAGKGAPLLAWQPPPEWGVSAHAKHLRNLYVYFWRWATWKVFDHGPGDTHGVVCFITVAGFLNGPGFERMRDYLRRRADDVWVIDCSPEGHQPDVPTRVFQGVQQPVCIVLASRSPKADPAVPATVRFRALPAGEREEKFKALAAVTLDGNGWVECPTDWRAPFLPVSTGAWSTFPVLDDLFVYDGSGVMPGRTWIIAPDEASLPRRWTTLVNAPANLKEDLFYPHMRGGEPGDKHVNKAVSRGLPGYEARPLPVADDSGECVPPAPYAFRSFDRQWIIPDNRLINQPNPELWGSRSGRQIYLTAPSDRAPTAGPGLTFTSAVPDLHHYNGRGGRVYPLWSDKAATVPNVRPGLLKVLSARYGRAVTAEDVVAYIAAVAAHPAYTARFKPDLVTPGLRIPFTAEAETFADAVDVGRAVVWLHTFGERFADPAHGRPAKPPRVGNNEGPRVPTAGEIGRPGSEFPDTLDYDPAKQRLLMGDGYVERVPPAVWAYEVSGKQVLRQWFSYRKRDRERPLMGDRRPPSKLGEIQPGQWPAEYTAELLNVLHVLARLVGLEPASAALLDRICGGPTLTADELRVGGAYELPADPVKNKRGKRAKGDADQISLLGDD